MKCEKYVNYEDFGAVGDGVTNDFAAIKAAHDYANENGLSVKTDPSKTYYISDTRIDGAVAWISIKTPTNWSDTHFIIDDTDYCSTDGTGISLKHVFIVESDYPEEVILDDDILSRLDGIGEGTEKLDIKLGYPALLFIYNENKHVYGRSGASFKKKAQALGPEMHEAILVDGDGNIDASTPFIFNYEKVTKIEVIRCDITPITLEGGVFTTRASHGAGRYTDAEGNVKKNGYVARGLRINRSYTTLKNVRHYVEGEITTEQQAAGILGSHYHGFFAAYRANEVILDSCVLTGRRYYHVSGTYDFTANEVNVIRLINCTQSNFRMKDEEGREVYSMSISPLTGTRYCWGIGGTNFCKNMEYIDSTLSRFDAHQGLYNGKIINSSVNVMALTGNGTMVVENTKWFSADPSYTFNCLFHMRGDYGSTWQGDMKVKNLKAYFFNTHTISVFMHSYANWYYGYDCYLPSVEIDGFEGYYIEDKKPMKEGSVIKLMGTSIVAEPAMHLPETKNTEAVYPYVDLDGDGLVDGTDIPYDTEFVKNSNVYRAGLRFGSYKNLNPITPPEYFKAKNIKGGIKFAMPKTHLSGTGDGGFLGKTKFYYDDESYVVGTDNEDVGAFEFSDVENFRM